MLLRPASKTGVLRTDLLLQQAVRGGDLAESALFGTAGARFVQIRICWNSKQLKPAARARFDFRDRAGRSQKSQNSTTWSGKMRRFPISETTTPRIRGAGLKLSHTDRRGRR